MLLPADSDQKSNGSEFFLIVVYLSISAAQDCSSSDLLLSINPNRLKMSGLLAMLSMLDSLLLGCLLSQAITTLQVHCSSSVFSSHAVSHMITLSTNQFKPVFSSNMQMSSLGRGSVSITLALQQQQRCEAAVSDSALYIIATVAVYIQPDTG